MLMLASCNLNNDKANGDNTEPPAGGDNTGNEDDNTNPPTGGDNAGEPEGGTENGGNNDGGDNTEPPAGGDNTGNEDDNTNPPTGGDNAGEPEGGTENGGNSDAGDNTDPPVGGDNTEGDNDDTASGGENNGTDDDSDKEIVDFTANLKLDMNSDTLKQEVILFTHVDGDTTYFKADDNFKVRYIAINTPESTGKIEEWGKRASAFTKAALEGAESIIVESDNGVWNTDSTGSSFIAWVWYRTSADGEYRNLNLELLQNGLALLSGATDSRYGEVCTKAYNQAREQGLYIHSGEKDPDYCYDTVKKMTLKELRLSINDFISTKVMVEGVVTCNDGNNGVYIESYDEETERYYGVYVYYSANPTYGIHAMLTKGNLVRVVGTVTDFNPENPQISGLIYNIRDPENEFQMKKLGEGYEAAYAEIAPRVFAEATEKVTVGDEEKDVRVAELLLGTTVSMKDLYVESVYTYPKSGTMTLHCKVDGVAVEVRTNVLYDAQNNLITAEYFEGKTFDVKGVADIYEGSYQIAVFSLECFVIH